MVSYNKDDREELDFDPVELSDQQKERSKRKWKNIFYIISNLIIISLVLIIRYAHPQKPKFVIQDATIFIFNLSSPSYSSSSSSSSSILLISSTLQITVASKNPNDNSGIYYEDLSIYAEYMNQQITYQVDIPRAYQGHKETNVWSLLINGTDVPIAPYNVPVVIQDQSNGIINLVVKLDGHVRWKIWSLNTRRYHIHVQCNALIDFGGNRAFSNSNGYDFFVFSSVKYLLYRRCSVAVSTPI